jgi:hypothetical protein
MAAVKIVVAWHNPVQFEKFLAAWGVTASDPRFHFQRDKTKAGCALTKNAGVAAANAGIVIVLDDDCYPAEGHCVDSFIEAHVASLEPAPVEMFEAVTLPASRGTPYYNRMLRMPVAASMGYWRNIGDYDAPSQLAFGADNPMRFTRKAIHGRYFPLSGMNIAFRPKQWFPWCQFIDVPRFDDIWMGWLWQKEAYSLSYCFNLTGPDVFHSRQSNVWQNLRDEARHLERNETLWQDIAVHSVKTYESLRHLLP